MIRELGRVYRFPFVPADRRKAPMEAAIPTHTVFTSCKTTDHATQLVTFQLKLLYGHVHSALEVFEGARPIIRREQHHDKKFYPTVIIIDASVKRYAKNVRIFGFSTLRTTGQATLRLYLTQAIRVRSVVHRRWQEYEIHSPGECDALCRKRPCLP